MSAPDSRPALPIHLPFDSISPSFSKNSPCVFQVLGYYLTSLGEMPCGGLLCAYAGSAIRPLSSASVAVGQRRLQGFYKKKLDTNQDTHCIKIGVQLWRSGWDSNPRNLAVQLISSLLVSVSTSDRFVSLSGRFVCAENRIKQGFFALKALSQLHFFKVGSNRYFCRFWREIRGDRREIGREGNTKLHTLQNRTSSRRNLFLRCIR